MDFVKAQFCPARPCIESPAPDGAQAFLVDGSDRRKMDQRPFCFAMRRGKSPAISEGCAGTGIIDMSARTSFVVSDPFLLH
jgi:hypothetical protein